MPDTARLQHAFDTLRDELLAQCTPQGHWVGELASSAVSTATAISALALVERHAAHQASPASDQNGAWDRQLAQLSSLICHGVEWLADQQNDDGGWGDTDKSHSNVATTMLVRSAFQLSVLPAAHGDALARADDYLKRQGGITGIRRRYGRDKTFAVPILTNAALADLVPWHEVAPLPFELASLPQAVFRFLRLPVVSYAIPALVAVGQARYVHRPPLNPLVRLVRHLARKRSLRAIEPMQPDSGGFLEATPLTSFVVMALASSGHVDHPVVRRGVEFIVQSARADGSWPIDTNLATWVTTLSINALAAGGENVSQLDCWPWLLSCQHRSRHPFTGAEPGGWGWTDLSGAVPDADDTPGALLALAQCVRSDPHQSHDELYAAARDGIQWLLDLQNNDGGWPTFCRGWGHLPFDRSGTDLTAHAMRALHAWRGLLANSPCAADDILPLEAERIAAPNGDRSAASAARVQQIERAISRGFEFLRRRQRDDGAWLPLWFGNQNDPREENPVYGTSRVLLAYRDLARYESVEAHRAVTWLCAQRNSDGGWGGSKTATPGATGHLTQVSSLEETALAVEALLPAAQTDSRARMAVESGIEWLIAAVEEGRHREASPIGFYFARLWYYERLYPLTFSVSALGHALQNARQTEPTHLVSQPTSP